MNKTIIIECRKWIVKHYLAVIALTSLIWMFLIIWSNAFLEPIRADGHGYYSYLPSIFIYNDASFETLGQKQYNGDIPSWTGIKRMAMTGRYANKYGIGTAFMMTPFFLLAHLLTWLMQSPGGGASYFSFRYATDGYTLIYQFFAAFSGWFYALAGLYMLKKNLERFFSPEQAAWTILLFVFGTNLFHYMSAESVLSHPYTLFSLACFMWLIPEWYKKKTLALSVGLGICAALIVLIRISNAIYLLLFPLYGVWGYISLRKRVKELWQSFRQILLMMLIGIGCLIPQLLSWKYSFGSWIVNSYGSQGEGFDFIHPQVLNVLFSLKGGYIFWAPLLILPIIGWPFMKEGREWKMGILLCSLLQLWLVSSWHMWTFGGGFGHRAFIDTYMLWAFPLATTLGWVGQKRWGWLVVIFCIAALVWNIFMMKLYCTREISYYGLDWPALFDIFWIRKQYFLGLI